MAIASVIACQRSAFTISTVKKFRNSLFTELHASSSVVGSEAVRTFGQQVASLT
jgi:hypothetical protein